MQCFGIIKTTQSKTFIKKFCLGISGNSSRKLCWGNFGPLFSAFHNCLAEANASYNTTFSSYTRRLYTAQLQFTQIFELSVHFVCETTPSAPFWLTVTLSITVCGKCPDPPPVANTSVSVTVEGGHEIARYTCDASRGYITKGNNTIICLEPLGYSLWSPTTVTCESKYIRKYNYLHITLQEA